MFWTAERREILCSRGVPSLVNRKLLTAQRAERTADGLVVQSVFQRGERAYSKSWLEWVGNLGERWKVFHVHRMGWFLPEIPLLFGLLWTVSQRCFWQPFGNCGGINRIIQSVMKGKRIGNSAIVHCSPQGDLLFWDPPTGVRKQAADHKSAEEREPGGPKINNSAGGHGNHLCPRRRMWSHPRTNSKKRSEHLER